MTKLGPRKSKMFAIRPARTLPSSPGIVSSVIGGVAAIIRSCDSASSAARTSAGSAAKLGDRSRLWANSGKLIRIAVR